MTSWSTKYIQDIHIMCIKNLFVMIALAAITLPYESTNSRTIGQFRNRPLQ